MTETVIQERAPLLLPPITYDVSLHNEWRSCFPSSGAWSGDVSETYASLHPWLSRRWGVDGEDIRWTSARARVVSSLFACFAHETPMCTFSDMTDGVAFGYSTFQGKTPVELFRREVLGQITQKDRRMQFAHDSNMTLGQKLQAIIEKYKADGTPIISFRRANKLVVQWDDNNQDAFAFDRPFATTRRVYEVNPVYLGTVMPLYAAEALGIAVGNGDVYELQNGLLKKLDDDYLLFTHIYLPEGSPLLSRTPVVLTDDGQFTLMKDGDMACDQQGRILFEFLRANYSVCMDGCLDEVALNYRIYDRSGKSFCEGQEAEKLLAKGCPAGPLSAVISKIDPEAPLRERIGQAKGALAARGMII